MFGEDTDWWHLAAVGLLVLIAIADVGVPAKVFGAMVSAEEKVASGDVTPEAVIAALPSLIWPVVCIVVGLAVVGIAAWRMWDEGRAESRWLWVFGSAALTVFWSGMIIVVVVKASHTLASYAPNP